MALALPSGHQEQEPSGIDVMRLDQTRHVACASSCMSMRTSLEEGIKLHRFAGILPEQSLTEAGRHCVWSFPAPVGDAVHLPAFFPKFRISSTFSSILAACRRGISIGSASYRSIASILKTGLDKAFLPDTTPDADPIQHGNIRGRGYYH